MKPWIDELQERNSASMHAIGDGRGGIGMSFRSKPLKQNIQSDSGSHDRDMHQSQISFLMQIVFSLPSLAFTIFFPISLQRQKILDKKASRADSSMKGRNWRSKTLAYLCT